MTETPKPKRTLTPAVKLARAIEAMDAVPELLRTYVYHRSNRDLATNAHIDKAARAVASLDEESRVRLTGIFPPHTED